MPDSRQRDDVTEHRGHDRPVAPGGWKRAVLGLLVGALTGAAIAFVLPRDDLPRRRSGQEG